MHSGVIAEKASDTLFTLDTTGSQAIQTSYNKFNKPLKADQILAQRSAVPAVDSHKRPGGITDGVIEPSSKKRKTNGVSLREYERLREVAYGSQSVKDVIKSDGTPHHDPWAQKPEELEDPRFSYLEKAKPIRAPPTLKEAPISLAAGKGEVCAIPAPKPGTSYNPVFQEWNALLITEGKKEVEAEKKRLQEAELDQERSEHIAVAEKERDLDVQTEDESAWEGFESDFEGAEWLKKKRPERKTPSERNKIKRRKEAEKKEKWAKAQKEREKRERQIGEIIKKAKEETKQTTLAKALVDTGSEDSEEVDERVLRRRKLGKDVYVQPLHFLKWSLIEWTACQSLP